MMKLRSPLWAGCALGLAVWIACDAGDSIEATRRNEGEKRADSGSVDTKTARLGDIRSRADAAFADMAKGGEGARTPERFETRIGSQPWPADLPENWPKPSNGRVVANTRRTEGDRLLLVDLPLRPSDAFARYEEALRDQGYEISESTADDASHGLRARRGRDEAVLRFFGHEEKTRVEILFVAKGRG